MVQRAQQKKTMKNRIRQLRSHLTEMRGAAIVAFQAGRESVLRATEGMEYGAGYMVSTGGVVDNTNPTVGGGDNGWPVMAGLEQQPS